MQACDTTRNEQCMVLRLGTELTGQSVPTMKDTYCTLIQRTVHSAGEVAGYVDC